MLSVFFCQVNFIFLPFQFHSSSYYGSCLCLKFLKRNICSAIFFNFLIGSLFVISSVDCFASVYSMSWQHQPIAINVSFLSRQRRFEIKIRRSEAKCNAGSLCFFSVGPQLAKYSIGSKVCVEICSCRVSAGHFCLLIARFQAYFLVFIEMGGT